MRSRFAALLALALSAVVLTACVAASASEPRTVVTFTADSVVLVYAVTPAGAADSVIHRAFLGASTEPDSNTREARAVNDSTGRTVRFAWPKALWTPNATQGGQACSAMVNANPEGGASLEGPGKCEPWTFTRTLATPAIPTAVTVVSVSYN